MNTNPKCIVNCTQPTLRWYHPNILWLQYLAFTYFRSTMHCGWWFLFARRDAGNTYHVTEWYFCLIKVIGTVFQADCNTAVIYTSSDQGCHFGFFFFGGSPNSVLSHGSRKLTLHIPPTKIFWNVLSIPIKGTQKTQSWMYNDISHSINSLL